MDRLGACLKGFIMNGADLIKGVDFLNREKNIPRDLIFSGIEKAVRLAISKKYETEEGIEVSINRETGDIKARYGDTVLTPDELGRIAAQSAKQLMIQNFREAESEETFGKYKDRKGDIVYAIVQRVERGLALCNLESDKVEAILPKSEQIPGEMPHTNERLKAIILDVRRTGNRVKIVLSRTHPDFLRRLFEEEIPEIADHVVEIRAVSREAGHRSKIAVSSVDMKVDCVGSCLGTKGSRIKTIIEELGGQERIDVVRWNDSLQVLIDNTLNVSRAVFFGGGGWLVI
jgi:N utilization substance protein A